MTNTRLDPFAVFNQPPLRGALDLWDGDPCLVAALGSVSFDNPIGPQTLAGLIGPAEIVENAHRLNTGPAPRLERFDTGGRRIDRIIYPEPYHALLAIGIQAGYAALPWTRHGQGGHTAHAAMVYLMSQVEPGCCCPMTMTYAAIPALQKGEDLASELARLATTAYYDRADTAIAHKQGATIGMAMTEKQGGSDVRANTTTAEPGDGGFLLTGHKWFCSAPMSDAFLTLAQRPEGLTCFVVPRRLPDGTLNAIHLMALKNKLGNRANASAEIEYHGAYGEMLGPPGQGIRTILDMVHHTRLDTAMAPAGLMRRALTEALYWARNREAFGKPLIDHPLMCNLLADLTLEWNAAFEMAMCVARSFDAASGDAGERSFARLAVALAKFWNNLRCVPVILEAMQVLGGMGYVESTPLPFLYREAPLNGIWEGAGNVIALDILRTLEKDSQASEILLARLRLARGQSRQFDTSLDVLETRLTRPLDIASARHLATHMALLLQAAVLLRRSDTMAGEIFASTRLGGDWGHTLGTLPPGTDTGAIVSTI